MALYEWHAEWHAASFGLIHHFEVLLRNAVDGVLGESQPQTQDEEVSGLGDGLGAISTAPEGRGGTGSALLPVVWTTWSVHRHRRKRFLSPAARDSSGAGA